MQRNGLIKFGRILLGCGIGTLIGILSSGEKAMKELGAVIFLAILAIIIGLSIVFISKNKTKLEELQSNDYVNSKNTCPNCGLPLSEDCKQCPKCKSIIERR